MSVKLFAAAVVLLVGVALASLFPSSERDVQGQSAPAGVALRRDAPPSERVLADAAPRSASLPSLEAAVTAPSDPHASRVRSVPSTADRSSLRSPPPMPSRYASVTEKSPPDVAADHRSRARAARRPRANAPRRETVHRIVDGDTLPALADRYLGDAALADRIRQANQDRLPENPNWLPIGIELQIPAHTTDAQPEPAIVARSSGAETRLVPIEPTPVVADTQSR